MTNIDIQYPWALFMLFLIPVAFLFKRKFIPKTGFSAVTFLSENLQPHFIKKYGADIIYSMFVMSSILALANLQYSSFWQKTFLESKWIMIVQDLSGSMNRASAEDARMTLGDVTLEGAKAFIDMREEQDLIGLIAFSSYAKLISPPTFDKDILKEKLKLLSRGSDSIVFRELTVGGATNASYAAWLALCTFLMLIPEENQLSFEELHDLRNSLLGKTLKKVSIPNRLKKAEFGHGMAIVMFTDGRIESNKSDEDVRKGLPNFVNVVKLIQHLGVKLYLIVAGGDVNQELKETIESHEANGNLGRIFYMPRAFDLEKIKEAYTNINQMEKNRLLVRMVKKKKDTRQVFGLVGIFSIFMYCFLKVTPWTRTL